MFLQEQVRSRQNLCDVISSYAFCNGEKKGSIANINDVLTSCHFNSFSRTTLPHKFLC